MSELIKHSFEELTARLQQPMVARMFLDSMESCGFVELRPRSALMDDRVAVFTAVEIAREIKGEPRGATLH